MADISKLTSLPVGKATPSHSSPINMPTAKNIVGAGSGTKVQSASLAAGIVAAVAALASSGIGYASARKSEREQRKLLATQREQALEDRMHDEQYNSPASQLARLRIAGISPTSLHDVSETDSSGMAVQGDPNALSQSLLAQGSTIQQGFTSAIDALALNKQRAEIDKIYSDIAKNSSSQRLQGLQSDFLEETFTNRVAQEKFQALSQELGLQKLGADIDSIVAATANSKEERKIKRITISLMTDTYSDTVRLARLQADNAELDNKIKDYDLRKVMPARLQKLVEETNSIRQSTQLSYEQFVAYRDHLEKSDYVLDEQGKALKFNNDAMQATYDEYVQKLKDEYHITEVEAKFAATREVMKLVNQAAVTLAASGAAVFSAKKSMMKPNSKIPSSSSYGGYDPYQMVFD